MAWNMPDGCNDSWLDSIVNEVECPTCHEEWEQEINKGWGYSFIELECEECGTTWKHEVLTHSGD